MGYGLFVKSVSAYLTASIIDAVLTAIFLYLIALRVQQSSNSSSSVPFRAISSCAVDCDLTAMEIELFINKNEDFLKKILVFGTADKIRTCDLQSRRVQAVKGRS